MKLVKSAHHLPLITYAARHLRHYGLIALWYRDSLDARAETVCNKPPDRLSSLSNECPPGKSHTGLYIFSRTCPRIILASSSTLAVYIFLRLSRNPA